MKYFYLLFLSLISLCSIAQTTGQKSEKTIQGKVLDNETKEPIPFASVRLLTETDSLYTQGTSTAEDGTFRLTIAKKNKYILEVSFIGYKSFFKNINTNDKEINYSLGDILLEEAPIELEATVVEGKVPDIQVKGDTIQYNAGAFKTEEHELLQDLIKKLPGIEIDANGNIKANGKPIQKILVDGNEFFGEDIAFALNNLPANMIKNLQLFKEQSEEAKTSGVKDQDPPQVLNLVIKEEFKKSVFGNAGAGYGSNDRYQGNFSLNRMHGDNQYSLIGQGGNAPMNGGMMGSGDNVNKDVGANFNVNPSDKVKINGSVDYSYNKSWSENKNESYTSLIDRYSFGSSNYKDKSNSGNARVNLDWKPDSLTTIFIRSSFGLSNNISESYSSDSSYVTNMNPTIGFSSSSTENQNFNNNNYFMISRKLNSKGRSIRLSLNNSIRNGNSDGNNYSKTIYPDTIPDRIIDNISTTKNKSTSYSASISYVEPLGKDNLLQFQYSYRTSNSERDNDARKKNENGEYTIVDSTYTRVSKSTFRTHNVNLRFQSTKEKYNYSIGFNIDPTYSNSKVNLGDSIIEDITQNTINFSPAIQFGLQPNENTRWIFDYSGSTSQPSSRQLSGDTIVHNSLSRSVGNPNLKTSYSNRIGAYFMKSDYESGRYINLSFNLSYTFNNIADYTIIDKNGNKFSTYKNVDGNMNAFLYATYNTPLKNKKFQISFDPNIYYNKSIGYTNGEKSVIQTISFTPSSYIRFNSDKFESSLRVSVGQNISFNNLSEKERSSNTRYSFSNNIKWKLPYDFTVSNNVNWILLSGYGEGSKNSELLWSASIEKLVLKKQGTLRAQFVDILDDKNNEMRMINGSDYNYSWSNNIGRYFMLSFSYRFKTKGSENTSDDDYMY